MTYRLLVTGSRNWTDVAAIHRQLMIRWARWGNELVIVHGHAPDGVDAIADAWAVNNNYIPERWPADWTQGRGAGFTRNRAMVDSRPDECLAFIGPCVKLTCRRPHPHGSHGASHCAGLAEHAGIRTTRYTP